MQQPDINLVGQQHHNRVLVATVYANDPNDPEGQIVLRRYLNDVICDEREEELDQLKEHSIPICKYEDWDDTKLIPELRDDSEDDGIELMELEEEKRGSVVFLMNEEIESVGCPHNICGCEIQCPTCLKFYGCRQCHNDEEDDHSLDRKSITTVRCRACHKVQPYATRCAYCDYLFCTQTCPICKFMCCIGPNSKPSYHCDKCGVCRVGFAKDYKHCDDCGRCVYIKAFQHHRCRRMREDERCPICLSSFLDSVFMIHEMHCGHRIHSHCYSQLLGKSDFTCPICRKYSITDRQIKEITDQCLQIIKTKTLDIFDEEVTVKCYECQTYYKSKHMMFCLYQCPMCGLFNSKVFEGDLPSNVEITRPQDYKVEPIRSPYISASNVASFIANWFEQKGELQKRIEERIESYKPSPLVLKQIVRQLLITDRVHSRADFLKGLYDMLKELQGISQVLK